MIAAEHGDRDMVHLLVEYGCNINKADPYNNHTPLRVAVDSSNPLCVQYLIDNGAIIDSTSSDIFFPVTPLLLVIDNLWRNTPANITLNGTNCVNKSINLQERRMRVLDILLKNGAGTEFTGYSSLQETALMKASRITNKYGPQVVLALLKHGAYVNHNYHCYRGFMSPLSHAVVLKNHATLKILIAHGSDVHFSAPQDELCQITHENLAHLAVSMRDFITAKCLVYAGCKLPTKCDIDSLARYFERNNNTYTAEDRRQITSFWWLYDFKHQPKNLKWTCKHILRQQCSLHDPSRLLQLGLPKPIINYILCKDL